MTDTLSAAPTVETALREAGRLRRKVRARVRFQAEHGESQYDRSYEPYAIENGEVVVFSLFRNEFRKIRLSDISRVQIMPGEFRPRRPIEL